MKNIRMIAAGLVLLAAAVAQAQDPGELEKLLLNRTGENRKAVGIVVGLVDATGERFLASGATAPGGAVLPGADTVYEIGSITKVFTSLVLADMVVRGEVGLDDPVAKFLPATVKVPERDGKRITLRDLSNQVSGLPRMPDNLKPADGADPYVDYGPDRLYEFLARCRARPGRGREIRILQSRRRTARPRPGPQGRDGLRGARQEEGPRAVGHGRYGHRARRAPEGPAGAGQRPQPEPGQELELRRPRAGRGPAFDGPGHAQVPDGGHGLARHSPAGGLRPDAEGGAADRVRPT